jgi:DNA-binding transcriptional MerR regulator
MAQYSIKDIEVLSGIKAHTLRIWELRYDFLKPKRTDTNIRFYDDEQLKLILNIGLLNKNGYRISKIAEMNQQQMKEQVLKIANENQEPDALLDSLIHSMLDFDEMRFEKALNSAILKMGFERTFIELIFPFMERSGMLWTAGAIRPSQEHFISNLIRRKLLVAIDNQYIEKNSKTKKFILFLPEGDWHELVLLFTEYLLRSNNHEVAYIGNSVPFEDIDFIKQVFKPDYLLTYITILPNDISIQEYVNKISSAFLDLDILVGGYQANHNPLKLPKNVHVLSGIESLKKFL